MTVRNKKISCFPEISCFPGHDASTLSVSPVLAAKNLGFHFDHKLSMDDQINYVSQICYLNLRNIRKIGNRLTYDLKVQLVHATAC